MDVDLLKRHFAHIGARVQVRSDGGRSRRMVAPEGGVTLDVVEDRFGELFDVWIMPTAEPRIEVLQAIPNQRHLLLLTQAHSTTEKNKFLCGHDERHWFVAAVPGRSVATVSSAMEALKPPGLAALEARFGLSERRRNRRKNEAFRRQGEWFFVPVVGLKVDPKLVLHNEPVARSGSKVHWLEFAYRSGGETVYVTSRYPSGLTERDYRQELSRYPAARTWHWRTMRRNLCQGPCAAFGPRHDCAARLAPGADEPGERSAGNAACCFPRLIVKTAGGAAGPLRPLARW